MIRVSDRDWRSTFLPAFKACVEAGTYSLMCSYNRINGVPSCANKKLLTDILRTEWGFKGYVVSDEMALEWIITGHHYANDNVTAAATAVEADVSLEISPDIIDNVFAHIGSDVQHSHRVKS